MITLACWVCSLALMAQDTQPSGSSTGSDEIKTLFGNGNGAKNIPLGYFFELNGGYTKFGQKSIFLPGISFGLILDHHWTIGLAGNIVGNWNGVHYNNLYYDSVSQRMRGANLNGG